MQLTAEAARRFLVRRHLLDPPRSLPATASSVLTVVARLGSLQFDPLEVPGARNHDLVLHARIARYERAWCDQWLYGNPSERRLFEAYNKSLNILPVEELSHYRLAWARARARYAKTILSKRSRVASHILARIEREGALSSQAFKESHKKHVAWHWAPTAQGRAVLEALFESGHVGISKREGSRRSYDLIERLFPEEILAHRVSEDQSVAHKILSRYRGHGLLGPSANPELWVGTAPSASRARIVEDLVAQGILFPVEVEGVRGFRYILREERDLALASGDPLASPRVTFVAPLDPIVWDRRLLKTLFGFDYIWEVYTPEAKRRHGYYVLPILFGDRFVGRIEPRFDRKAQKLVIRGLWLEDHFASEALTGDFRAVLAEALTAFATFVGARATAWPRTRLGRALRL